MKFLLTTLGISTHYALWFVVGVIICSFICNDNRDITNLDIREHVNKGKRL